MTTPDTDRMEDMFDSIAPDYDRLNHLLSFNSDRSWRKRALKYIVDADCPQTILDLACGTGDFSIEIARRANPRTVVTGLDISDGMLKQMRRKVDQAGLAGRIRAEKGNAESLPFPDRSFDCVSIAFGIRNFEHREEALREILRVLKPGGRLVMLELSVPSSRFFNRFFKMYLTNVLPFVGGTVSGEKAAYQYLPDSVLVFPDKDEWMGTLRRCGFAKVRHKAYSMGICRLYTGEK